MTISWKIENCERDADTDIITVAHWRVTGTEDELTATRYGSVAIPAAPEGVNITPYGDVTEDDVLSWVFMHIDKDEIEANVTDELAALASPAQASGLPWN